MSSSPDTSTSPKVQAVFTGIVREVGRVEAVEDRGESVRLVVRAPETAAATAIGDSVALAGVCLTAVEVSNGTLAFDAVPETLSRSTLDRLEAGGVVNIEPALRAGEPLGGHIVQGHVDGVGRIRRVDEEGIEVEAPADVLRYCVEKGSIAVEGVSLTIATLAKDFFTVALIPHTREATTLGSIAEGDDVNLEVDVVAKYVERLTAQ
jgi:riboflavin synthase